MTIEPWISPGDFLSIKDGLSKFVDSIDPLGISTLREGDTAMVMSVSSSPRGKSIDGHAYPELGYFDGTILLHGILRQVLFYAHEDQSMWRKVT